MADLPPPWPNAVMVEAVADRQPYVMLGFVASGEEPALSCVEGQTRKPGLTTARTKGPNDISEVMVNFLPSGSRQSHLQAYRDIRSGSCKNVKVEVTIVPLRELRGGKGLDAATIANPTDIVEPK